MINLLNHSQQLSQTEQPYPPIQSRFALSNTSTKLALSMMLITLVGCQSLPPSAVSADATQLAVKSNTQSLPSPTDIKVVSEAQQQTSPNSYSRSSSRFYAQLDNGLKVIIQPDHRAPVVMTQIWYRVGSADEPADKGGISHLLEHMMFKGTDSISSDAFEQLIAKHGGNNNAFTSYDYTGYYELLPANYYPLALELEADRMRHLRFDSDDFAKERQVVMEERRQRTDDNPLAKAYEAFRLLALPDSPKGESVIGPMAQIQGISLADLQHWYQTWYSPNNATLVLVGDVEPNAAMQHIKRYFADIEPSTLPKRPSVAQAGFRGYGQHSSHQAVQVPVLFMGYNVSSLHSSSNPDTAYALALLQDVMDGGLSARMEKHLVREQGLLASVGVSYNLFERGDGLLMVQATPRDGVSLEQAQAAIIAEFEQLKTDPISATELARAKTNIQTALIYAQDSLVGQAQSIGSLSSIGLDDQLPSELPKRLQRIQPEQIKAAAKQYLVNDNLTVMYVLPDRLLPDGDAAVTNLQLQATDPQATDPQATDPQATDPQATDIATQ